MAQAHAQDMTGHIRDGKLLLDQPLALPEGAVVRVHVEEQSESLLDCLRDVIGQAKGLPADYALNHEHYLYGGPKQEDE